MRIATPVTRSLVRNDSFGASARVRGRFVKRPYGGETTTRSAEHRSATTSGNVRRCEGGGARRREGQAPPLRRGRANAGTRPPCVKGAVTRTCERDWGILNPGVPLQIISPRPSVRTGPPPLTQGGQAQRPVLRACHRLAGDQRSPLRARDGRWRGSAGRTSRGPCNGNLFSILCSLFSVHCSLFSVHFFSSPGAMPKLSRKAR
jgi:hypothetical protein